MTVVSRRADRNFEKWGPPLCQALSGLTLPSFPNISVEVKYATEHRCGVRLRGPGLSDCISGTDPLKDNLPLLSCSPTQNTEEAKTTSAIVNELSTVVSTILREHPLNTERAQNGLAVANCVLFRGAGARVHVQPFEQKHKMKAFAVAPTAIIAGLAESLGIGCFVGVSLLRW